MSGLVTFVWLFQSIFLFVASVLCFLVPAWCAGPLAGEDPVASGGMMALLATH